MQLRLETRLTGEQYVSQQAWRDATLSRCPLHPGGGCGFRRHGTYPRQSPPGTRIARFYCWRGHCTFSLLPDCLAARWPGTLAEVEAAVVAVEQANSVEAACSHLRLEIDLPGVLRWVRRRVQAIHASLLTLKGLLPARFGGCAPTCRGFSERLGVKQLLVALRDIAEPYLHALPAPLGFHRRRRGGADPPRARQQSTGPDPPAPFS